MQDVHLDVLREDTERDLDGPGRPSGVEQRAEDGIPDRTVALLRQRRLGQAAADEIADVGYRRGARGKYLEENDDRHDLDRVPTGTVNGLSHRISPQSRTQRAMAHVWAEARLFDSGHDRKL